MMGSDCMKKLMWSFITKESEEIRKYRVNLDQQLIEAFTHRTKPEESTLLNRLLFHGLEVRKSKDNTVSHTIRQCS